MDTEEFSPGCGAGCDCEDCEAWRRYCYWNHAHGGTKQFLLFASGDKDHLCIPWEVGSQLRNMIPDSEPIILEAPDGHMYSVDFVKFGLITLTTGWRGFVDANHIRQGDPILFVYCGSSRFKVHIFSSSGHEISPPCSQQPPGIYRADPPCDHHVLNGHDAGKLNEAGLEALVSNKPYMLPERTKLIGQQEEKVKEKVRAIGSEFPVFVRVMTAQDVWRPKLLYFSKDYASACGLPLGETPLLIGLQGSKMKWPSTLVVGKCTNVRISSFWKDLVSLSGMKAGDICLFELVDRSSETLTMTVHLIRKSEMQL